LDNLKAGDVDAARKALPGPVKFSMLKDFVGGFSPDLQPTLKPAMSGVKPPTEMKMHTHLTDQHTGSIENYLPKMP
jgi:hypothetical protein